MSAAAIARANGAKSNGPVTPEGKAKSAQNSRKHGLTGKTAVLAHESQQEFDELEASYVETYKPATAAESDLVGEMVNSRWRLRRMEEMEAALFESAFKRHAETEESPSAARALAYVELAESKSLRTLSRYSAQSRRAYEKARNELLDLQAARLQVEELPNEPSAKAAERMFDILLTPPPSSRRPVSFERPGAEPTAASAYSG